MRNERLRRKIQGIQERIKSTKKEIVLSVAAVALLGFTVACGVSGDVSGNTRAQDREPTPIVNPWKGRLLVTDEKGVEIISINPYVGYECWTFKGVLRGGRLTYYWQPPKMLGGEVYFEKLLAVKVVEGKDKTPENDFIDVKDGLPPGLVVVEDNRR